MRLLSSLRPILSNPGEWLLSLSGPRPSHFSLGLSCFGQRILLADEGPLSGIMMIENSRSLLAYLAEKQQATPLQLVEGLSQEECAEMALAPESRKLWAFLRSQEKALASA